MTNSVNGYSKNSELIPYRMPYVDRTASTHQHQQRRNHNPNSNTAPTTIASTPPVVSNPAQYFVNVQECLENMDNLLLASPIREGRPYSLRISLSPSSCIGSPSTSENNGDVLILPSEVLLHILEYLPIQSLVALRAVCSSWKTVIDCHDLAIFKPRCLSREWLDLFPQTTTEIVPVDTNATNDLDSNHNDDHDRNMNDHDQNINDHEHTYDVGRIVSRLNFDGMDDIQQKQFQPTIQTNESYKRTWGLIYASHHAAKHVWLETNGFNDINNDNSRWHSKTRKLHMDFKTEDWGQIMEMQLMT